jgi:hypothetical protein
MLADEVGADGRAKNLSFLRKPRVLGQNRGFFGTQERGFCPLERQF